MHLRSNRVPIFLVAVLLLASVAIAQTSQQPQASDQTGATISVTARPHDSQQQPAQSSTSAQSNDPGTISVTAKPKDTGAQPQQQSDPGTISVTAKPAGSQSQSQGQGTQGQPSQQAPPPSTAQPAQSAPTQSAPTQSADDAQPAPEFDPNLPPGMAIRVTQTAPADNTPGGKSVNSIQVGNGQPAAQEPTTNKEGVYVFVAKAEEVLLHATVVDERGRLVTDLPKDAFTVIENGKVQPITAFGREDIPVALGILIDNSGSMRPKRDKVNTAALDLVRASRPDDKVFIVNFNEEYFLDQDFTSDIPKMKEALEKVESRGGTALYDAVVASADYLQKSGPRLEKENKIQKRVLLVVTDGEDNSSRESLEQVVRRMQDENAPTVYTIGILSEERTKKAQRALRAMAEQTGGLSFFPKDASEVDEICKTIARDIRSQYTIGFKKTTEEQGYRQIKVLAHAHGYKNLQVRTLTGYFAGQERASVSPARSAPR
jgi:Ca-activated chloride channel homolog